MVSVNSGKVTIVASGLRDTGGHNYPYTRAVTSELHDRGFGVEVLANRLLSERLSAIPEYRAVFSKGTYDFPHGQSALHSLVNLWTMAKTYRAELDAAIGRDDPSQRLFFCHTMLDFELLGWDLLLRQRRLNAPVVLMLRGTPDFAAMGIYRRWIHPYTGLRARSLASINRHTGGRFVLATDTELLTADYARVFGGRIATFPIPVPNEILDAKFGEPHRALRFGYMGDCRAAKGFARLAPMISRVLSMDAAGGINFVVQLYKGTYEPSRTPPGWNEIEELAERFPTRVTLVRGVLDDQGYADLFFSLDAVLVPNDHPVFRAGSSNVFCEAVAAGKPVITADETWMATQLARYGGGRCFSLREPSSFADAVLSLAQDWNEAVDRAQKFSAEWRAQHNTVRLVDTLLRSAEMAAPARK